MDREAFGEQLFSSVLGYFAVLSINLGLRLGLYQALADGEPVTSDDLAQRAEIAERYAREWLEQQATAGILRVEPGGDANRFSLPPAHAEVLLDGDSLSYMGSGIAQLMSIPVVFDHVAEAFRTGGGVAPELYGAVAVDGQGGSNRPTLLTTLPKDWLPAIPSVHERLSSGPSRVLDVGCGVGWSSIAMALAYPQAVVDGVDPDELSVQRARANADAAGVADRVRFHQADASTMPVAGPVEFATAFECIHDMSRPVEVLRAVRGVLRDDGAMLVVDERTNPVFTGAPDPLESYFYGWSLFDCLPVGMSEQSSAGTGTVMRPETLRGYATEAGFGGFEILPIEHDSFRLYLLRP